MNVRTKRIYAATLSAFTGLITGASPQVEAQPSSIAKPLPEPYSSKSSINPPSAVGWPPGKMPKALDGFTVSLYAENLFSPRWMYVLPNGDVLVAEAITNEPKNLSPEVLKAFQAANPKIPDDRSSNQLVLLRDTNGDGIADERKVFLKGLHQPFGMGFFQDKFYVAETDKVSVYPYDAKELKTTGEGQKIIDLPANGYNNHWTRNLLIDPGAKKIYVTVGSGSNVDEDGNDTKDPKRAAILQADLDGSNLKIFASGLRNPIGLAFEPQTKTLWTTVNERDGLGDDLVPDYITSVKEGGFYGWPFSYYGQHADPRKKGLRDDLVKKAIVPDFQLGSHVAALGLCFSPGEPFPKEFQNGAFVGEHGSWNRAKRVGYKVVFVPFKSGEAVGGPDGGKPIDFLTGFNEGEDLKNVYGRPVGVAIARDGALLVADDTAGKIWRVSRDH